MLVNCVKLWYNDENRVQKPCFANPCGARFDIGGALTVAKKENLPVNVDLDTEQGSNIIYANEVVAIIAESQPAR